MSTLLHVSVWIALSGFVPAVMEAGLDDPPGSDVPAKAAGSERTAPSTSGDRVETGAVPEDAPSASDPCAVAATLPGADAGPLEQAAAQLAHGQCLLVTAAAPGMSALWRGEEAPPELTTVLEEGLRRLAAARESAGRDNITSGEINARIVERIEMLEAFGRLFRELSRPAAQADEKVLLEACHGVALYMDESEGYLGEAARLWQSVGYRRLGRTSRRLEVLSQDLSLTSGNDVTFAARLERAKALGDAGRHAAGIVLCLRLRDLAELWPAADGSPQVIRQRSEAVAEVERLRVKLMRDWAATVETAGQSETAVRLREDAKAVEAAMVRDAEPYVLSRTLPGLKAIESSGDADSQGSSGVEARPAGESP